MMREFYVYECGSCKGRETYPVAADLMFTHHGVFPCQKCKGPLSLVTTRKGTLTLHPKTGHFCIEEDLEPKDYP